MIDNDRIDDDRISDEDLLLFHYRDGLDAAQSARIERALQADPTLAQRYSQLCAELELLRPSGPQLAPDAARSRWLVALQRQARLEASAAEPSSPAVRLRGRSLLPWLGPALAALVFMSFGIGLGRWIDSRPGSRIEHQLVGAAPSGTAASSFAGGPSGTPLIRGVGSHFASTSVVLDELQSGDPARRDDLLAESIARNRMYTAAAEAQGDAALARVLRAFDVALSALAADRSGNGSFAADRAQLEFELEAMQTRLAGTASKPAQAL